jgi:hypothetical protein
MSYPNPEEVFNAVKARQAGEENPIFTGEFRPWKFSFFPGTNPDVTADQLAETIINAMKGLANGDCRDIDLND